MPDEKVLPAVERPKESLLMRLSGWAIGALLGSWILWMIVGAFLGDHWRTGLYDIPAGLAAIIAVWRGLHRLERESEEPQQDTMSQLRFSGPRRPDASPKLPPSEEELR